MIYQAIYFTFLIYGKKNINIQEKFDDLRNSIGLNFVFNKMKFYFRVSKFKTI